MTQNPDNTELSLTNILQAHDILLSILLGQVMAQYDNPESVIGHIDKMVDIQEVNEHTKEHIRLLLKPLKENLIKK